MKNQEWSFNFHDNNWNRIAEYGEREIYLDLSDGLVLDETWLRVTSFVHKADTDAATWTEITKLISTDQLKAIDTNASWDQVKYVEIQDNSWTAKENLYRSADDLWSDSEELILVHGDDGNGDTIFMGSIAKRDGFIVVALFWVVLGIFGASPLYLSNLPILSLTDAIFESISGLTTTGATIISGLDLLPKSVLVNLVQ